MCIKQTVQVKHNFKKTMSDFTITGFGRFLLHSGGGVLMALEAFAYCQSRVFRKSYKIGAKKLSVPRLRFTGIRLFLYIVSADTPFETCYCRRFIHLIFQPACSTKIFCGK